MFLSFLSAAVVLLSASAALATPAPQATGTLLPLPQVCTKPTYGPFKLFVRRADVEGDLPAKLYVDSRTPNNATSYMVVDTNPSCTNCGHTPSYWQLKQMQLFAVDATSTSNAATVNQDVPDGSSLSFVTSTHSQPSYPFYCAEVS
ncbi:hypothetical protein M408DRAFT_43945, partial [Serendipita vermifera MAFF 305830]